MAIDTGGTFTDAIGVSPAGTWHRVKVPSDGSVRALASGMAGCAELTLELPHWVPQPERFLRGAVASDGQGWSASVEACRRHGTAVLASLSRPAPDCWRRAPLHLGCGIDAPMLATFALVGRAPGDPLPPVELRLATTRGTNAMLEGAGAKVGLLTSAGFGDLLSIGDQSRPDIFALAVRKPAPLAIATVAVAERRCASGEVRLRPTRDAILAAAAELRARGATAVAVAFLHSLAHPEHERDAVGWLAGCGFDDVVASCDICESPRLLTRAETAIAHAAVAGPMRAFLAGAARHVPSARTFVLTSAGGLQRSDRFLARDSFLSGPAGGVAGIAEVARRAGIAQVLGLDMGGTSADVARFGGEFAYRFETRVGNARVAAPSLGIETVAAGGGSICSVARGELRVGPESARAHPGPACYGLGGPLTLTDVHLLLGRIDPARASVPLSPDRARAALDEVRSEAARQGLALDAGALLEGFIALADERMAGAIAAVTTREGFDPREHVLLPFGGAGGLHACGLAERLGITRVLVPADAGLLSARGLLGAPIERIARAAVLRRLGECAPSLAARMDALATEARDLVRADAGDGATVVDGARTASVRLVGQDRPLEIPFGDERTMRDAFHLAFRRIFGYGPPARELEVEALTAIARTASTAPRDECRGVGRTPSGALGTTPVWERGSLAPGLTFDGPCLLVDMGCTAFVAPGWRATVLPTGDVTLARADAVRIEDASAADLELFTCRVEAIASAMGEALRRTAFSTNVKERLDYSCAVLDADGMLVVNAPHLPVHLGAIGACVRSVAATLALGPGDVAVTNHPAFGGSHLPDITVITPVHASDSQGTRLVGYVANRAHHAELGGTRPGSFPPDARSLSDEGVVLEPSLLVERGESRLDRIEARLRDAPYPSRAVEENLADLQAAIAANELGARALAGLAGRYGQEGLARRFAGVLARGEAVARDALRRLGDGERHAIERLDDGAPIEVRIVPARDGHSPTRVDFSGSAPTRPDSFNAPLAVVRSATLYALRLLVGEAIPLNEGMLRAIELIVPQGMLNPPFVADPTRCPPVVAGNTETSQRVTDALLRAFGVVAGSQGTMNNLLFGNARFSAYETICGGAGATRECDGADAVHTHMTNTRITDPEVLERRAPVLIREFAIRRGSGGAGRRRGGDGAVREIEFLEDVELSLLAQHRVECPYSLHGARPGAVGRQWIVRTDGRREAVPGVVAADLRRGEAIRIETPGGGGCG